jgi:hypothetical protein
MAALGSKSSTESHPKAINFCGLIKKAFIRYLRCFKHMSAYFANKREGMVPDALHAPLTPP